MTALLDVDGLTRRFGQNRAVDGISFVLRQNEICGLIGPNGSGKTTTFNMISGFLRPTAGDVRLNGRSLVGKSPNRIARAGLVRTFQIVSVYRDMTVRENLRVAHHIYLRRKRDASQEEVERSCEALLQRFDLETYAETLAASLPAGVQRSLSVANAVACRPKILLLDEPLAGLNASEKRQLVSRLMTTRASGLSILLVEHDVKSLMNLCDRLVVINFGKVIAEGTPEEVARNRAVQEAYLGHAVEDDA